MGLTRNISTGIKGRYRNAEDPAGSGSFSIEGWKVGRRDSYQSSDSHSMNRHFRYLVTAIREQGSSNSRFRVNDYRIYLHVRRHSSVSRYVVHPTGTIFSAPSTSSETPRVPVAVSLSLPHFVSRRIITTIRSMEHRFTASGCNAFTAGRRTFGTIDVRVPMEKRANKRADDFMH